ncbi:hypothetical protein DMB42_11685 [Nonomuraea sp. WAC 01424]|uniref:hypothetical protein n=1 Tax=Nonomuraea sp. WAC 01424 TaxID=2203200 RepID=UPI000F783D5E|nr:hypothetical protein [Nonomuraea sp. WAC 01424]RSN12832.1 hypothetical protein DMB42_11685 [Nonomuraea sp. WAC 01424]
MPDLPEEAVQAAIDGVDHEYVERRGFDYNVARAALTAAAPILAAQALREAAVIARLTGTDGPQGARSPLARRTWRMAATWLDCRADLAVACQIGEARDSR